MLQQTFGRYDFGRNSASSAAQGALNKQKGRIAARLDRIPVKNVHSLPFDLLTYKQCKLVAEGKLQPFSVGSFSGMVDLNKENAAIYRKVHQIEAEFTLNNARLPFWNVYRRVAEFTLVRGSLPFSEPALR